MRQHEGTDMDMGLQAFVIVVAVDFAVGVVELACLAAAANTTVALSNYSHLLEGRCSGTLRLSFHSSPPLKHPRLLHRQATSVKKKSSKLPPYCLSLNYFSVVFAINCT